MPGSIDRFERIDQERNRARGPRAAQEPLAIPGYRSGFNVTLNVDTGQVTLHPGVIAVRGQLVSVQDSIGLGESEVKWVQARRRAQLYYIYINVDGEVSVDIAVPQYDRDTFTYVNPVYNRRIAVGNIFVGNNRSILHASPGHRPRSNAAVASVSYEGPANYYCDGYDDDKEINTAIAFQMQANSGGTVLLSPGIFNATSDVDLLGAFINLEGSGRSTTIKGADIRGRDNPSQVRDLAHIYGGTTRYYTSWGGTVTTQGDTSGLEADLEAEERARIAADDAEETARVAADTQEVADRTNADSLEKQARSAADDDEAAVRAKAVADEAAQRALDLRAEANARIGDVDAEERARVAAVNAEEKARVAADTQEVADRTNADSLEKQARSAADDDEAAVRAKAVADEAAERAKVLAAEVLARGNADSVLQGNIDGLVIPDQLSDLTGDIGDIDTNVTSSLELASDQSIILSRGTSNRIVITGSQISLQRRISGSWVEQVEVSATAAIVGLRDRRIRITDSEIAFQKRTGGTWGDITSLTGITSDISDEETARIAADTNLGSDVSDEATARSNADDALQTSIDAIPTGSAATRLADLTGDIGDIDTQITGGLEMSAGGSFILRSGTNSRIVISGDEISLQRRISGSWVEQVEVSATAAIVGMGDRRIRVTGTEIAFQQRVGGNWQDLTSLTTITGDISSEKMARIAADTTEAGTRGRADSAEARARTSADSGLRRSINAIPAPADVPVDLDDLNTNLSNALLIKASALTLQASTRKIVISSSGITMSRGTQSVALASSGLKISNGNFSVEVRSSGIYLNTSSTTSLHLGSGSFRESIVNGTTYINLGRTTLGLTAGNTHFRMNAQGFRFIGTTGSNTLNILNNGNGTISNNWTVNGDLFVRGTSNRGTRGAPAQGTRGAPAQEGSDSDPEPLNILEEIEDLQRRVSILENA